MFFFRVGKRAMMLVDMWGKKSTVLQALLIIVVKATNTVMPLKLWNRVQSALFV